jgi:hypothetical protein
MRQTKEFPKIDARLTSAGGIETLLHDVSSALVNASFLLRCPEQSSKYFLLSGKMK